MNKFVLFFAVILTISTRMVPFMKRAYSESECQGLCWFYHQSFFYVGVFACYNSKEHECFCSWTCLDCPKSDKCMLASPYSSQHSFGTYTEIK